MQHMTDSRGNPAKFSKITVIVAVFNGAKTLQRCIDSVAEQTYPHKELIVMDGGSTDGTVEILKANSDKITYWESERDRGISHAWNKALDRARGEWICFLGADDYFYEPDVLKLMSPYLARAYPPTRVVYGQVAVVTDKGNLLGMPAKPWQELRPHFFLGMNIPHQGVFQHRSLFEVHGYFDESFRIAGDYELLMRELVSAEALFVPGVVVTAMQYGGLSTIPSLARRALVEFRHAQVKNGLSQLPLKWTWIYVKAWAKHLLNSTVGERLGGKFVDMCRLLSGRRYQVNRTEEITDREAARPYRVLFVAHSAQLAGAERSLLDLLSHLDRNIVTPVVLLRESGPVEQELGRLGVCYRKVPYEWWIAQRNWLPVFVYRLARTAFFFPRLFNEVRKLQPDLIYSNSVVIPEGAVLAVLLRKPHIWHIREILESNETLNGPIPATLIFRAVLRFSKRVVATTESVRAQFPLQPRKRVQVVYDGVKVDNEVDSNQIDKPVQIPNEHVKLALVGTLSAAKGQLDAIKAVELMRDEFPRIELSIVGSGKLAYRKELEQYIEAHRLEEHVSLLGYMDDPASVFRASDLSLVPSMSEGFGRVTVESLAAGTPVVGTDAGGTREILQHGGGVLVPPGRPDLLAQAVADLLRSPERLKILKSEARSVAERFSMERSATLIQNELVSVLKAHR